MAKPTTPEFTAPPHGSTINSPVLLKWTESTVPVEEDTTAPVFASASVAAAGSTMIVNLTETESPPLLPASDITGFTVTVNAVPVTISSATRTGPTEITLTLATVVEQGDTVTISYSPGNVTDSASNAMAAFSTQPVTNDSTQGGGSSGEYSPVVEAYITSVDGKRAALSKSPLTTQAKDSLEEFWQRIGNRDSELSTNLQPLLRDLVLLNETHNVGDGEEVVSLLGHVYTRAGGTLPLWGTDSMTFAGGTCRLESDSAVITTDNVSVMVVGRATGSGSRYIYCQDNGVTSGDNPYNWAFYTRSSNETGWVFRVPAAEGDLFSRWANGGSMNVSAPNWSVQVGAVGWPRLDEVPLVAHGFPACTVYPQTAVDSRISTPLVPNEVPTSIGARQGTQGSGFTGDLAIILSFGGYVATEAEWDAIYAIVAETVGASLSLPI